jgi:hypothetical protein
VTKGRAGIGPPSPRPESSMGGRARRWHSARRHQVGAIDRCRKPYRVPSVVPVDDRLAICAGSVNVRRQGLAGQSRNLFRPVRTCFLGRGSTGAEGSATLPRQHGRAVHSLRHADPGRRELERETRLELATTCLEGRVLRVLGNFAPRDSRMLGRCSRAELRDQSHPGSACSVISGHGPAWPCGCRAGRADGSSAGTVPGRG